ncbi:HEAT repeat domain-containing protein [Actinomadura rifamycini]|uniref:HEAT repeat domain-containing protein n=1 Tax=Actinomadura rifamycini TaxID=31962 RepID=UPI0003F76B9E|nr:HEAT repeat domain-containing protein [Actinomadura rifamycini]
MTTIHRARADEPRLLENPRLEDLEEYLRDPEADVRRAALTRLIASARRGRGPRGTGDALAWALADEHPAVRRLAATALRDLPEIYLGDDGVEALLLAAARGRDPYVRDTAAGLLTDLTEGAGELYARGLDDGDVQARVQAVLGLIALHAAARMAEAAHDPAREVRVAVADGLARLAHPAGLPALTRLLADHDPVVRTAALDAAAALRPSGPLADAVAAALDDPNRQIRRHAAAALAQAPPDAAIPPLVRALHDPTVDVRRAAIRALAPWTPTHPEAHRALTEALNDPDPGLRAQARRSLP